MTIPSSVINSYRIAAIFLSLVSAVRADVKLPAIFGDHMVLQQEATLPVWGTADAGEKVTVTVGTETGSATAGADGKWMVKLGPLPNGTAPVTMTVAGKNTLTFTDVLVGEVWICSGQSNMEFGLSGAHTGKNDLPKANDPQLRLFHVPHHAMLDPQADVLPAKWELCTPATVWNFTAVGYYFGRELRSKLNRPVGLIESSWGGTPAQAWTPLTGLQKDPELKHYIDVHDAMVAAFPTAIVGYPALLAKFQADDAAWQKEVGVTYRPALEAWKAAVMAARAAKQPLPPPPVPARPEPHAPADPNGGGGTPTALYNGMIAPLIPYAIKGVIWYQGESNANLPGEYHVLFSRMITEWREKWDEGDFPFLFVQLAAFGIHNGPYDAYALVREAQMQTLALPNTGMATAIDIGSPGNIHPQDKLDDGLRLALAARHVAYGENIVYTGPVYDSMKIEGSTVRVSYKDVGGGLIIGVPPWHSGDMYPVPTDKLAGFQLAGDDKNWFDADAKIDGATVVVSSAQVPKPVAVRYAFQAAPICNLYNKEMLPALPFRSDDWAKPAAATPMAPVPPTPPSPVPTH